MERTGILFAKPLLEHLPENVYPNPVEVKVVASCPWGTVKGDEAVSFNDVMSEQLAKSLDEEKSKDSTVFMNDMIGYSDGTTDCSDDYLLAQLLQLEFDKEHDETLKKEESKYNGDSKIKVSFDKYRRLPESSLSSDDDVDDKEYELEQHAKNHWHNIDEAERVFRATSKNGVLKQGGATTTKHDLIISGRRNVGKLMEFPASILTGDGGKFDMKIPNCVLNNLKKYSKAEKKRGHRVRDEGEKSTAEKALDEKTYLILYKLINNSILESLTGCISTGKEACVYHAWSRMSAEESPLLEYALKVYKTTLNEFKNRKEYTKDDHGFRDRFSKQNPRKVIHMWAEKEMRNLRKMNAAHIPCPEVICLKDHVLVMTFIGSDMLPAPKIKDVDLPFEDMTILMDQVIEIMKSLYTKCQLVHADLSEYNLLWHNESVWVIDVSQSVDITHPQALKFLLRDCSNISEFFQKKGVFNVPSSESLFTDICGKQPINVSNTSKSDEEGITGFEEVS